MKKLSQKNVGTKTGYYGNFNFFDTKSAFNQIFGTQPKIYHDFENNGDARYAKRVTTRFIDECCLKCSSLCAGRIVLAPTIITLLSMFRKSVMILIRFSRNGEMRKAAK